MTEYKLVVVGGKLQDISFVVGTTFSLSEFYVLTHRK